MNITSKRAEKLRPLIDELVAACSEFDDELAELEETETKGEDRENASEELASSMTEITHAHTALVAAMPKDEVPT